MVRRLSIGSGRTGISEGLGWIVVGQRNRNRNCTESWGWRPRSSSSCVGGVTSYVTVSSIQKGNSRIPSSGTSVPATTPHIGSALGRETTAGSAGTTLFSPSLLEQDQLSLWVQGWFENSLSNSSGHKLNPAIGKPERIQQIRALTFNHPIAVKFPPDHMYTINNPNSTGV